MSSSRNPLGTVVLSNVLFANPLPAFTDSYYRAASCPATVRLLMCGVCMTRKDIGRFLADTRRCPLDSYTFNMCLVCLRRANRDVDWESLPPPYELEDTDDEAIHGGAQSPIDFPLSDTDEEPVHCEAQRLPASQFVDISAEEAGDDSTDVVPESDHESDHEESQELTQPMPIEPTESEDWGDLECDESDGELIECDSEREEIEEPVPPTPITKRAASSSVESPPKRVKFSNEYTTVERIPNHDSGDEGETDDDETPLPVTDRVRVFIDLTVPTPPSSPQRY